MRINYKHLTIMTLSITVVWPFSSHAAKQRMVCPSDGKRPMFNIICPGGDEPIPIEEYENSRPPPNDTPTSTQTDTGSDKHNCSRMPKSHTTPSQSFEPEMVSIPAGCFQMGSSESESGRSSNESPQHRVCVKAFQMGKYEVTNAQFRNFRSNHNSGEYKGHSLNDDKQPVVNVTWNDAVAYAEWLSQQTGKNYRLPSEAEWEYAARAGTTTVRYWGDSPDQACAYANVTDKTAKSKFGWDWNFNCDDNYVVSAPVGQYQPNDFGLYDMLGNVWEWNQDKWHDSYSGTPTDGSACESGNANSHVLRGCSWYREPDICRSAVRFNFNDSLNDLGFRIAVSSSF